MAFHGGYGNGIRRSHGIDKAQMGVWMEGIIRDWPIMFAVFYFSAFLQRRWEVRTLQMMDALDQNPRHFMNCVQKAARAL